MSNRNPPGDISCLFCSKPCLRSSSSWTWDGDFGYRAAVKKIFASLLIPPANFESVLNAGSSSSKGGAAALGFCSNCQTLVRDVQKLSETIQKCELIIQIKSDVIGTLINKETKKGRAKNKTIVWEKFREPVISNYASGRLPNNNPRIIIRRVEQPKDKVKVPVVKVKKVNVKLKNGVRKLRNEKESEDDDDDSELDNDNLFVKIISRPLTKKTNSRRGCGVVRDEVDNIKNGADKRKLRSEGKTDSKKQVGTANKVSKTQQKASKRSSEEDNDVIYEGTRKLMKACTLSGAKVKVKLPNPTSLKVRTTENKVGITKLVQQTPTITLPPSPSYSKSDSESKASSPSHKRSVLAYSGDEEDDLLLPPDERHYTPVKYEREVPSGSGESEETEDEEDDDVDERVPSLGLPENNFEQKINAIQLWVDTQDPIPPEDYYPSCQDVSDDIAPIPYHLPNSLVGPLTPPNAAFTPQANPKTSAGHSAAYMARLRAQRRQRDKEDSDMEVVQDVEEEDDDVIIIIPDEMKKPSPNVRI